MTDPPTPDRSDDGSPADREPPGRRERDATLASRILASSPVGIVAVDADGVIGFANERAGDTLGVDPDALVGRQFDEADWEATLEDGTPVSATDRPVARVLATGDPVYGFEYRIQRPDGTERWVSSDSTPIRDEAGEVAYAVVAFADVTSMKRREERLTSDEVRLVEFRADETAVPPSLRVGGGDEMRLDVESVVSLPDGTCVQYMATSDLSASAFVTAVEEVPHYIDVRLLATSGDRSRVEAHAESATVSATFQSLGGRPRAVVVAHDEVRFLGEIPGDVDPKLAGAGIRRFHPEAELVAEELVYSPQLLYDIIVDALTDRQFAALETAYYGGYFESPRSSTGDELAARFDVTRQTFNQHLRNAQRAVFRALFEKSGAAEH